MANNDLDNAWQKLSLVQKKAAEWGDEALLVLAGPGSGKTRVLTCRIAKILDKSQDKNFRILGLTFTNKAADEMRLRVANLVPGQESRLFLGTFHSFCADVLRQHGVHLGINPNFQIYSQDYDLQAVLDDAVTEAKKTSDIISDLDKKTLPVIQRLKSFLIEPSQCVDVFRDKEFGKRMAVVYPAYEEALSRRNSLDFSSLIFQAYRLFTKFPAFAKRYRTVYPYICIDEFQDTNEAQYKLIRALSEDQYKNFFIVADDDQIIYQWNGASHKRIEQFVQDYSPEILQLPTNYRCPPEVVSIANNLISNNFLRSPGKKPLLADKPISKCADVVRLLSRFPEFETEAKGVGEDIKKCYSNQLGSVVILARNRKLLDGAFKGLQDQGIPAVVAQRKDEFISSPFVWLHSVLRLASNRQDKASLDSLCGAFKQLVGIEIDPDEVVTQAQSSTLGFLQNWMRFAEQKSSDVLTKEIIAEVFAFIGGEKNFRLFCKNAISWFDKLIKNPDVASNAQGIEVFAGYDEERAVWDDLVKEIAASLGTELSLEVFLQELQLHSKESKIKPDTVVLMSIHGAKGKEFDHVYLIGLVEDELPSFQSKQKGEKSPEMEEERRNCFVAITRAIKSLTLSYSEKYRGWSKTPSRFLIEMGLLNE
ncbi:MAG: ATP-dependent helicase [Candidatus Omnitrophica bacterium]|jgi:DNA helicase-2/ATP-dependent DNA helicase PcrA|nr:ATP-dependent helicase [Candidatus Omnitrophota bacterium]